MSGSMTRPVCCNIVDMPDGRFAVVAVLASGKVFGRTGLPTLAVAEECVELLRAVMAACGAPVVLGAAAPGGTGLRRAFGPPIGRG